MRCVEHGSHHVYSVCHLAHNKLVLLNTYSDCDSLLIALRLCGHLPFNGTTALELENNIVKGTLSFSEIEWISINNGGNLYERK